MLPGTVEIEVGGTTATRDRDREQDHRTTLRDSLPTLVDDTYISFTNRFLGERTSYFDETTTED